VSAADFAARFPVIAFTGRFQPFHRDHLAMVRHALSLAQQVVVGITNPDGTRRNAHPSSAHRHLDAANPFSYAQRAALIESALAAEAVPPTRYRIIPFPLEEPDRWPVVLAPGTPQLVRVFSAWEREKVRRFEAAGYPIVVLEGDPTGRVAGTELRRQLAAGSSMLDAVPPGARELLASWYARKASASHG
jgi:nicotinamide-nucleotide adenylyltransferase